VPENQEMEAGEPSFIGRVVSAIAEGLGNAWDTITGSPALNAMARQGADELGAALRAFPESIQQEEVGVAWNPPVSEIAAERQMIEPPANHCQPDTGRANEADTGYSM
jgi:hypothetical protein